MKRKDIEKAAAKIIIGEEFSHGELASFAIQQVNAALDEAANVNLDKSMREQYVMQGPRCLVTAANRIRALKILD